MFVKYTSSLIISPVIGTGDRWKLIEKFEFEVSGKRYVVPKGFTTDFASVPRLVRFVASPATGKHRVASVIHDFLYTITAGRKYADEVFLVCMLKDGVSTVLAYSMYYSVRMFGWMRYGK